MFEIKKDCYHCVHIRPNKKNLCSQSRKIIEDVHNYCCDLFKEDDWITRLERKEYESKLNESISTVK